MPHARWIQTGLLGALPVLLAGMAVTAEAIPAGGLIENAGQVEGPARYYAAMGAATLFCTDSTLVLQLAPQRYVVIIRFEDMAAGVRVEPRDRISTKLNYFLGAPDRWRSGVHCYRELVYRGLWRGLDLRVHPGNGALDYRVTASGTTDADAGAERGNIAGEPLKIPGLVLEDAPAPQGNGWRRLRWGPAEFPVPPEAPLLDPEGEGTLQWSTFVGGSDYDYGRGLALTPNGSPVIAGYTTSADFPVTPGAYDTTAGGGYDVFVAGLDSAGSDLLWVTFIGGYLEDRAMSLVLDSQQQPVVVGQTYSPDFPTTPGAYDRTLDGVRDAFACKLNADGSALLWSTFLGGSGEERIYDVALDAAGRLIVGGETGSSDFPVTAGAIQTVYGGSWDGFVAELDSAGRSLIYGTYLGGGGWDNVGTVVLDSEQRPVVCGYTGSTDFPTTPGAWSRTFHGGTWDAYVSRLDLNSSTLLASTIVGGSGVDNGCGVAVKTNGDVVFSGNTTSPDFPHTPTAYDTTQSGGNDVFVSELDPNLSELHWCTFVGGNWNDETWNLVLDGDGSPVFTGETYSQNYPTTTDAYDRTWNGAEDCYVTKLDGTGSSLIWSSFIGGNQMDSGWKILAGPGDNLFVIGPTRSGDFPTTPGAYDRTYNGGNADVYVASLHLPIRLGVDTGGTGLVRPPLEFTPNPFHDSVRLSLTLPRTQEVTLRVMDASGRLVGTLSPGPLSSGRHEIQWDGRGADGAPLPSGVYWVKLDGCGSAAARVVLVR
jgi:hypothetical protein